MAEALCRAHLDRGDSLSALITAEWCAYLLGSICACSSACSGYRQAKSVFVGASAPSLHLAARPAKAPNTHMGALHAGLTLCIRQRVHSARHARSLNRTSLHAWARYMRGSHFPGWARPREFHVRLLESVGRHEEARDNVRADICWHLLGRLAAGLKALGCGVCINVQAGFCAISKHDASVL